MARRDGYVIAVAFAVKAEFKAQFRDAILDNAATSLAVEPGCSVFEVCEAPDGAEIFLYEVYDDEAAFKEHLATEHFRRFDALTASWVSDKRVTAYQRLARD